MKIYKNIMFLVIVSVVMFLSSCEEEDVNLEKTWWGNYFNYGIEKNTFKSKSYRFLYFENYFKVREYDGWTLPQAVNKIKQL